MGLWADMACAHERIGSQAFHFADPSILFCALAVCGTRIWGNTEDRRFHELACRTIARRTP